MTEHILDPQTFNDLAKMVERVGKEVLSWKPSVPMYAVPPAVLKLAREMEESSFEQLALLAPYRIS